MATTTLQARQSPRKVLARLRQVLGVLLLVVLLASGGGLAWLYHRAHACLPELDGVLHVPGLSAPVEVRRDARGVPHLRAHSLSDLLFAQGFVTAQDRLWQMDLSRRYSEGTLSEVFGEGTLRLDIENRTLGLSQVMARSLEELDPESRTLLSAYTRGVNAFITSHLDRLPVEFFLMGYKPRPWREVDSLAAALNMMKALNTTWPADLMRERIRAKVSAELYADLFPDHSPLDVPVAPRLVGVPAGAQVPLSGMPQAPATPPGQLAACRLPACRSLGAGRPLATPEAGLGSNNWVVSGKLTKSGKPLLANDPHLGHSIPSVWYMVHLEAPGLNVSGVSLPGLPLVIIGHNVRIAWGMTNTSPDVQDLYVERFNVGDPKKYLHNGEWVEASERVETIPVRKQREYQFQVRVTRHGPVISHDGGRDLALGWMALEAHALRFPFLKIDRAQNWDEFTAALRDFTGPMQNFVYADVDGNIGYYAAGWVPIRKQGDGSVPAAGDVDDSDWADTLPFESLPHAYNPARGFIATANGRVVSDDYPYFLTRRWEAPYRTARINQLLEGKSGLTPADMLRIQTDIHTLEDEWLKGQVLAAAALRPPANVETRSALDLLRSWDGEARSDSAATLVLEVTRRALLERLLKPKLGDDLSGYSWPMSTTFVENVLKSRWSRWLPPGDADFEQALTKSLEEAVRRIPQLVSHRDPAGWKWGETIALTFRHRLSPSYPLLGRFFDVGPYPQAGTGTTVKQTTPTVGPSMRMVVDFSDLDNSVQNLTLGESGQPFSPYYRDQFEAWYTGRSFPMPFSDGAVDRASVHKLVLEP